MNRKEILGLVIRKVKKTYGDGFTARIEKDNYYSVITTIAAEGKVLPIPPTGLPVFAKYEGGDKVSFICGEDAIRLMDELFEK